MGLLKDIINKKNKILVFKCMYCGKIIFSNYFLDRCLDEKCIERHPLGATLFMDTTENIEEFIKKYNINENECITSYRSSGDL
jgi:ribosomal protein L31